MALLVALLSKQEYGTLFSAFRARLDTETGLALDDVAIHDDCIGVVSDSELAVNVSMS